MKQCPSCNSSQISLIEIKSRVPAVSDVSTLLSSPAKMAALGVSLTRSTNLPPVIGAIAGAVIGGVFMVLAKDSGEINQPMYYCQSHLGGGNMFMVSVILLMIEKARP